MQQQTTAAYLYTARGIGEKKKRKEKRPDVTMNYKIKLQSLLLCPGHKAMVQADIELVKTHRPLLVSAGGWAM